jgi:pseudaminic acid synthase
MNTENLEVTFVAEISANHGGSFDRAQSLVRKAAESGATAVKFQTYTPDTMTLNFENFFVSKEHELWGGRNLYELYSSAHTPWDWHQDLFDLSYEVGIVPFSTPFDLTALKFLEKLDCPMYKIASLETSDHRLIQATASTGKPIIISTGATEWQEIIELVEVVKRTGNTDLTLLLCTSSYPAKPKDAHLKRLDLIRQEFDVKVGVSDHTLGIGVSIAAIGLGAQVIEKHLTLKRSDGGLDSAFSLEPDEFQSLVREGKIASESLGNSEWSIGESEKESRSLRRSLYIVQNVVAGDIVTADNVRAIRPGQGCSPKFFDSIMGKRFKKNSIIGTPLSLEDLE